MKSLLVLAPLPQFADEVRAAVKALDFRVVHRLTVEEAEPLLVHKLAGICVLDLGLAGAQAVWMVEGILRRAPECRIIAFADSRNSEWEEELYLAGVSHILSKPIRGKLLAKTILAAEEVRERPLVGGEPHPPSQLEIAPASATGGPPGQVDQTLSAMRRFSEILTHSLDATALVRQFLHLLRETMGINRSAVFLHPTAAGLSVAHAADSVWMKVICSVGITPSLAEHLILSPESGIGGSLTRTGRILRRHAIEASDTDAAREFDRIGVEVAIPIMGREEMIGVVVCDRKVTGQGLTNSELETVFHLLEQVGQAITNIWMHDQLVGSNQLLGDVLRELSNACVVVGPDLSVLHANRAARRLVGGAARRSASLDFGDLPEALGSRIYQVIQTGAALPPFRYETDAGGKSVFSVSVVPIYSSADPQGIKGHSALMVVEDRTQAEQLKQLEVEAANLRLVSNMADRLAAEIGNAIVPLSVHHQLFDQRIKEAEFRKSLQSALGDGVKRVSRLASQMRFIYGNTNSKVEVISLGEVLDEADEEAKGYLAAKKTTLECEANVREATLAGSSTALKHTFSEIILNGYQANAGEARVKVRVVESAKANGVEEIGIEFEDAGDGFTEETARQASLPFYTRRTAGVGLGLSAARKILEDHGGRLEIPVSPEGKHGIVRVFLPVKSPRE